MHLVNRYSQDSNSQPDALRPDQLHRWIGLRHEDLSECRLPKNESARREILTQLAELDYQLRGGRKCACCRTHVRSVMRVRSLDEKGTLREYICLCRRCLEAEKAFSKRVVVYYAAVVFEEFISLKQTVERTPLEQTTIAA
jgi:hypothetical protein